MKIRIKAQDNSDVAELKAKIAELDEQIKVAVLNEDVETYNRLSNERNDLTRQIMKINNTKRLEIQESNDEP